MRAFAVTAPGRGEVIEVAAPVPGAAEVVVEVELAGVCGTDVELFTGVMTYLHNGQARLPLRLGHEWCGRVVEIGAGVDASWLERRVVGDTMLGCGVCDRCRAGRHHVCADRYEIGIRNGWPGALAERLPVPAGALHAIPEGLDARAAALVEPAGSAYRAVEASGLEAGDRLLVVGPGTVGLLVALFAAARGLEVTVAGVEARSLAFAAGLGFERAVAFAELGATRFDAVVDASTGPEVPARAVELVEPGRRVVLVGIAGEPSALDSRQLVFNDVIVVGVLGGSAGLDGAIAAFASGAVDPVPLVAGVAGLGEVAAALTGWRPVGSLAPKVLVDPQR